MDIVCDIINQRFAWNFRSNGDCSIVLTQNDDQPIRLYMVQPSPYVGRGYPFYYTALSGDEDVTCIVSLRDCTTVPLTLASTEPMGAILNGFDGVLHLNTEEVATFLSGRAQRDADFCIDLIDTGGHRISVFRRSITLRATDSGTVTLTTPGVLYSLGITGLTGGGATNLDGLETVGRGVGSVQIVIRQVSGAWTQSSWRLTTGTAAEDEDGGIIRPDDYADTTNEKVWVRTDGL